MQTPDVVALLERRLNPDLLVLLDDGDYFVEHNLATCLDTGGGWLQRRWPNDQCRSFGHQVLGTYRQTDGGTWLSTLAPERAGPAGHLFQTEHESRNEAIASLWLNRHRALSPA